MCRLARKIETRCHGQDEWTSNHMLIPLSPLRPPPAPSSCTQPNLHVGGEVARSCRWFLCCGCFSSSYVGAKFSSECLTPTTCGSERWLFPPASHAPFFLTFVPSASAAPWVFSLACLPTSHIFFFFRFFSSFLEFPLFIYFLLLALVCF